MECGICFQRFSFRHGRRKPKVLPCGHSLCVDCVTAVFSRARQCPTCRVPVPYGVEVGSLPSNYSLLEVLEKSRARHRARLAARMDRPASPYGDAASDSDSPDASSSEEEAHEAPAFSRARDEGESPAATPPRAASPSAGVSNTPGPGSGGPAQRNSPSRRAAGEGAARDPWVRPAVYTISCDVVGKQNLSFFLFFVVHAHCIRFGYTLGKPFSFFLRVLLVSMCMCAVCGRAGDARQDIPRLPDRRPGALGARGGGGHRELWRGRGGRGRARQCAGWVRHHRAHM